MDTHPSASAPTRLRLGAHQALLCATRAGTWLQVEQGTLIVQATPRWLGGCMRSAVHRLAAGDGMALDGGWWNLSAAEGAVLYRCVSTEPLPADAVAGHAWQRVVSRAARALSRMGLAPGLR